jgi:hypothetical protein
MNARETIPNEVWESREPQGSSHIEISEIAGQLWLTPAILTTWEPEIMI